MAATDSNPRPNSGWTFPVWAFSGAQFADWPPNGRPHMTEQAARAGLMGLDMLESWFTASRQMIDLWRTSVREQQDAMLASWRQQIASALAHDLLEDMEAPAQVPAKRQPRTQTAVAKASVPEAA